MNYIFKNGYIYKKIGRINEIRKTRNIFNRRKRKKYDHQLYPDRDVQLTMNYTRLTTVINQYIPLKKRGKSYIGPCPFCREISKKTSIDNFVITDYKRKWKCFGCGAGGNNAVSFIMRYCNISFVEAFLELKKYSTYYYKDNVLSKYKRDITGEDLEFPF